MNGRHIPVRFVFVMAGAALLASACSDELPPEEQLQQSVDRAEDSLDQMRERGEALAEEIEERTSTLRELADKQLTLLSHQISTFREELADLSAERRAELQPLLDEVSRHYDRARTAMAAYIGAAGDEAEDAKDTLDETMDDLRARLRAFRARLDAADE